MIGTMRSCFLTTPEKMIPYGRHFIDEDDIQAVVSQMRERTLTQGATIEEFERAVAARVGARFAVAVSSGTAALHLSCLAAGVGPGDVVITSAVTFVASANCARYAGGTAKFADIDPKTINMDPVDLERRCARESRLKVIIPVHFGGLACDMKRIRFIADRHGSKVIEDASHALGGRYANGSPIGSCEFADMVVFSFHPVKSITAGEGGMVTTNDEKIYAELLRLRSHGINKGNDPFLIEHQAHSDGVTNRWYYEMQELGYNYRLTEIQAALALSQLKKLDRFVARRRELALSYESLFRGTVIQSAQTVADGSAHHLYLIRAPFGAEPKSRNSVMQRLFNAGIVTQVHYIPVPMHPYYRQLGNVPEDYPQAMQYYSETLSIPLFYSLKSEELAYVADQLLKCLE